MAEPEIYVRATAYEVSVFPDEFEDASTWTLSVEYRGADRWAVLMRAGSRTCLNRDGEWAWEISPSERTDEWLAQHRFSLDEALDLARRHAPGVTMNSLTAVEVLERHRARSEAARAAASGRRGGDPASPLAAELEPSEMPGQLPLPGTEATHG
jgi:hypothetical protein